MTEDERELRDPALAALLQETFRDDPALAPAPGRTERIMRAVLVAGPRRQPHPFWASLAWGFGATAVAALLLVLIVGLGKPTQVADNDRKPAPPSLRPDRQQQHPMVSLRQIEKFADGTANSTPLPRPKQEPIPQVLRPKEKAPTVWEPAPRDNTPVVVPPAPDTQSVTVAAALYEAGNTAYQTGDYESAYQAFQDSYDTVPTPEAALSTGKALARMARQELASANPET